MAYDPFNGYLYVGQRGTVSGGGNHTVGVFTTSGSLVTSVGVPSDPTSIAVDPLSHDVYVAGDSPGVVYVLSASTNKVLEGLSIGALPISMAFTSGGTLYVSDPHDSAIYQIKTCGAASPALVPLGSQGWLQYLPFLVLLILVVAVLIVILLLSRSRKRKKANARPPPDAPQPAAQPSIRTPLASHP